MTDFHERLREEFALAVSEEARARHLTAIRAGLASSRGLTRETTEAPSGLTRRVAAGAAAFGLLAVPTGALAQSSLPGDVLHPVKLALEPLQALFNADVRSDHRLAELAALLEDEDVDGDELSSALDRAQQAVGDGNASDTAVAKIQELQARAEARLAEGKPGVGPPADRGPNADLDDADDEPSDDETSEDEASTTEPSTTETSDDEAPGRSGQAPGRSEADLNSPADEADDEKPGKPGDKPTQADDEPSDDPSEDDQN